MSTVYRIGQAFFNRFFRLLFKVKVFGAEKIPPDGGVVLCSNHISNWDPLVLGTYCPRKIRFMAKEELFRIPILSSVITFLGAYPVKRGAGDRAAIRTSIELARSGEVVGIFPEGTRSKTGKIGKVLPGAAMIALRSGAPVVPAAIIGSYRLFRPLTIVFGDAIDLKELVDGKGNNALAAEIIMNEIQKLMSEHTER